MADINYTRHARVKFEVLKRHGFEVTPDQVEETVINPEKLISQPGNKFIAQRGITERHVLRVVYRLGSRNAAGHYLLSRAKGAL